MNFDAKNNDRDLIKDVEYCPFCNREGDITIIHPKPDIFHPPTGIGNWCLEFWNLLKLGSIKYKKIIKYMLPLWAPTRRYRISVNGTMPCVLVIFLSV
jgi:hypothetical protein